MSSYAPSYELCFDPRDGTMLIYRSVRAGVCGPFTESLPCQSREHAERMAEARGFQRTSDWETHTNYDSADLIRVRG